MRLSLMTRILLGVLAVIIAYFFLVEQKHRRAEVEKTRAERRLFTFPADSVQKFILFNPDGERIEAERNDGGWTITAPVVTTGDGPTIDALLRQIVPGRRNEELTDVPDLSAYGLEKPFATIILFTKGGSTSDTLFVGDKTPTSSNSYVRLGSSRNVFISTETTHNVVRKSLYHLRDKSFLTFNAESVNAVAVRRGGKTLDLTRIGRYWWFTNPRVRANRTTVEQYLTRLTGTIVRAFPRENTDELSPFGLERPVREITLTRGSEKTTVTFGKKENDQVYALRTGLDKVTLLDAKLLDVFDWNMRTLRAKNLAFFDPDSVGMLTYETPDTSLVLRRTAGKWTAAGADSIAASKSYIVDAMLRKLTTATFDTILAEPALAGDKRLEKWTLRVTVRDAVGGVIDRITLAQPNADGEVGTSQTANVLGGLKTGTFREINDTFKRIGAR
jgi:hypothetical protein